MLTLYRPYIDIYKTGECLSDQHRSLMKLNSYLVLTTIFQMKGWIHITDLQDRYKDDPFVKLYYNDGKPYVDLLLEYYYTLYFYWLKSNGDVINHCADYECVYNENKKNCTEGDFWTEKHTMAHKLNLLNYDRFWYKRHFRPDRNLHLDSHHLTINGRPRLIARTEIKVMGKIEDI